MYVKIADYEYLIYLRNKLSKNEIYDTDVCRLDVLLNNLQNQKSKLNEYARKFNSEKRKTNKLYGRSKKEIEAYNKAQLKRSVNYD